MSNIRKISVKVDNVELSLEGTESFINQYEELIGYLSNKITAQKVEYKKAENGNSTSKTPKVDMMSNDLEEFALGFNSEQPSENVHMLAAYHYSQYGSEPVSFKEIKEMADSVGVLIPNRPGMTLKNAQKDGNSLFKPTTRGHVKPTIHGQKYFNDQFKVTKGNLKKEVSE